MYAEEDLDEWASKEFVYLNLAVIWIWLKKIKRIQREYFISRLLKWRLVWAGIQGSSWRVIILPPPGSPPGSPGCALWWDLWPQSMRGCWLLLIQPPWLSLLCVCLCFPSTEPGIFPLSIFSPGSLDHPGIQSWTEFSGAVRCTPGLAFRSVSFWRWFQRMGCSAFWGLTSLSGGLAGQHFPVLPHVPLCTPASPIPSSHQPSVRPSSLPSPAGLPWLACAVLPSLRPVVFCLVRAGVSKKSALCAVLCLL